MVQFFIAVMAEICFIIYAILCCDYVPTRLTRVHVCVRVTQLNFNFTVDLVTELNVVLAVNGVLMLVNALLTRAFTLQVN